MSLRSSLRKKILPLDDILRLFEGYQFDTCLDIGAGTGLFLELLYQKGIIRQGLGVEVNSSYFRKINDDLRVASSEEIGQKKFDLIMFNDVLHHMKNYREIAWEYISSNLCEGGAVLVKDMNDRNVICKYFNRMHDMIMARELIREVPVNAVKKELFRDFEVLREGRRRIFLYDHYFLLLRMNQCPAENSNVACRRSL